MSAPSGMEDGFDICMCKASPKDVARIKSFEPYKKYLGWTKPDWIAGIVRSKQDVQATILGYVPKVSGLVAVEVAIK